MDRISNLPAPRLEVRDLRVVVALHRAGTTAAAARLLNLTQSAVSRALATAEEHAGVPLFQRAAKGLAATEAGRAIIDAAPQVLGDLCALERRVRAPLRGSRRLRVVASCAMIYPWLTRAIVQLEQCAREVRVDVRTEYADSAIAALEEGKLDAAFITGRPPRGLPRHALFEDELVFVASSSHPAAEREHLRPRDLLEHVLLVPDQRSEDDWFLRAVFGRRRPKLRVRRLPITEAMVELARAGMGITILSEWLVSRYLDTDDRRLRVLRLSKPLLRPWSLVHRPEAADVVPLLLDVVKASQPRPDER